MVRCIKQGKHMMNVRGREDDRTSILCRSDALIDRIRSRNSFIVILIIKLKLHPVISMMISAVLIGLVQACRYI